MPIPEGPDGAELRHIRDTGDETLRLVRSQALAFSAFADRLTPVEMKVEGHEHRITTLENAPRAPLWRRLVFTLAFTCVAMAGGGAIVIAFS